MSITSHPRPAPAQTAGGRAEPLCLHEFDDGGLCAHTALPDTRRCAAHQDDGQPDIVIGGD